MCTLHFVHQSTCRENHCLTQFQHSSNYKQVEAENTSESDFRYDNFYFAQMEFVPIMYSLFGNISAAEKTTTKLIKQEAQNIIYIMHI